MKSSNECLVYPTSSVFECLKAAEKGKHGIAIVVDEHKYLLGIITDYELRKALLEGEKGLNKQASEIMNKEPVTALVNITKDELIDLFKKKRVSQIPILDDNGTVAGLESYFSLLEEAHRDNYVVIMAGGRGKRLRPMTDKTPKPLLNVGGKTVIETTIERLKGHGFRNYIISINYKAELFKEYLGDGYRHGVSITYVEEDTFLGTSGCLGLIKDQLNSPFLVVNGDVLTKLNYENLLDYHIYENNEITICVRKYDFEIPYGVVENDGHKVTGLTEKPQQSVLVNAGVYALNPSVLSLIPKDQYLDMPSLISQCLNYGHSVGAFPVSEYWIDIGSKDDFKKAKHEFCQHFG